MITWSVDHVTNENHYISSSMKPKATKLDREVASDKRMLSTKSHNLLVTWALLISISTRPVVSKHDGMVAYDKKPQTTNSHFLLIT